MKSDPLHKSLDFLLYIITQIYVFYNTLVKDKLVKEIEYCNVRPDEERTDCSVKRDDGNGKICTREGNRRLLNIFYSCFFSV